MKLKNSVTDLVLVTSTTSEAEAITCAENPDEMGLGMREDFAGKKAKFESMIVIQLYSSE